MKKLCFTILSILLIKGICFGADLSISPAKDVEQVSGKQIFKASIGGDSDNVVIGDEKNSTTFKNKITFKKWKNAQSGQFENSLSIIPPQDLIPSATVALDSKQLVTKNNTIGFYYNKDPTSDDNFKFGLILYEKPKTNTWSFQLEGWEEFDFFYQPPLTQEWKIGDEYYEDIITQVSDTEVYCGLQKVIYRPPEVVSSYAVYHKTKANYILGQINYTTGKIGHIFRPKFIDANNNWVWCDLNIDNGIYKVTCPQNFLDTAIYPVKANDTIGILSVGGSDSSGNAGWAGAVKFTMGVSPGTCSNIKAAVWDDGADSHTKLAIYTDSSGPSALVTNSYGTSAVTRTSKPTQDSEWTSINITATLTASNIYWLALHGEDSSVYECYDTGSTNQHEYHEELYADFPTTPAPTTSRGFENQTRSIYATYTPAAASTDQKSFQFFAGSGALPQHNAVASQSTVTVTNFGNNTASTRWTINAPQQWTSDLIVAHITSDANVTHGTLPGGPRGEVAWTINTASLGDTATANQRISCWYWTASGNNNAWSIVVVPSATEQFTDTIMRVPAGQYNTTTPIGESANRVNSANVSAMISPSWTVTAALGRVVVWIGDDQDPLVTAPTGWSAIASVDRGECNGILSLRDAVTTANEVVASAVWTIASDSYCSIGYVINAPADTGRAALAAKGTNVTCSVDTDYGLDIRIQNTGATSSDAYKLQYNLNSAGWVDITDVSSVIKASLTGDFANGADVPEFVLGTGTYDTDNNSALESAGNFTLTAALAGNHSTECHLNFQIPNADVVNGDSIQVRIIYNAGGALEVYTLTPTITVSEGGEPPAYTGAVIIMVN